MSFSIERFFRKDSVRSLVALTVLAALILWWDFADDPYREAATQALMTDPEIVERFGEVREVSLRRKTTLLRDSEAGAALGEDQIRYIFQFEGARQAGTATVTVQVSSEDTVQRIDIETEP